MADKQIQVAPHRPYRPRRPVRGFDPFRALSEYSRDDLAFSGTLGSTTYAIGTIRRAVARSSIAQAILRQLAINVVGPFGPQPNFSCVTNSQDRDRIQDYWDTWAEQPTVEGRENWMQYLRAQVNSKMVDGRVFSIARRHSDYQYGFAMMPLTREWLAERGSMGHVQMIKAPDGTEYEAVNGVCRGASGRVKGYVFYDGTTPTKVITRNYYSQLGTAGIMHGGAGEVVFVYVDDCRDFRVITTADDYDGRLLMMYPLINTIKKMTRLDESLLTAMYASACKMGFITKTENAANPDMADENAYIPPERLDELAVGLEELPVGYGFTGFDPSSPNMEQWRYRQEMAKNAVAGLGMDYASAAGDLREVNYSSMRHGALAARENYRLWQRDLEHMDCVPTLRQLLDFGYMMGFLRLRTERSLMQAKKCDWQHKAWQWVDPIKDAQASQMLMAMGVQSPQMVAAGLGVDYETVLQDFAEVMETMAMLGVKPGDLAKISGQKGGGSPPTQIGKDPDEAEETDENPDGGDDEETQEK